MTQTDMCVQVAHHAVEAHDSSELAWALLSMLYSSVGGDDGEDFAMHARNARHKALQLSSPQDQAYLQLARLLADLHLGRLAETVCDAVDGLEPQTPAYMQLLMCRARAAEYCGNDDAAVDKYQHIISLVGTGIVQTPVQQ
jgi:hypothetical protein